MYIGIYFWQFCLVFSSLFLCLLYTVDNDADDDDDDDGNDDDDDDDGDDDDLLSFLLQNFKAKLQMTFFGFTYCAPLLFLLLLLLFQIHINVLFVIYIVFILLPCDHVMCA